MSGWRLGFPDVGAAITALGSPSVASWSAAARYFACDGAAGDDGNQGWSDVSQSAAGLVAVKTIGRLLQLIPRFGAGRVARAAIKAGNYASDSVVDLSGFQGYTLMMVTGTATVASAGATAFAGDAADGICAGMQNATGMNAAGYNATSYSVAADGTPTITLQLNGGGAPGFGAVPNRPYRCRLRFGAATTTAALRNKAVGIVYQTGGDTLTLSLALGANPVGSDVCYIEMPGVTGPGITLINGTSCWSPSGNPAMQLCGLSLGNLQVANGTARLSGCEAGNVVGQNFDFYTTEQVIFTPFVSPFVSQIGNGLGCSLVNLFGGSLNATSLETISTTTPNVLKGVSSILLERGASGTQWINYGGASSGGNQNVNTLGTNASTAHGATFKQWGTCAAPSGTIRAGMVLAGDAYVGRTEITGAGANPAIRVSGTGLRITLRDTSGSTGNTDVGLDLSPNGSSGGVQGAQGCTIALITTPTVTGTAGDVRLSDGTIINWATAAAGVRDVNGNEIFGAGNAPP